MNINCFSKTILLIFLMITITMSCSELNEDNPLKSFFERISYERDIVPIFESRCISCHSGQSPDGNYDLSSILKILENGTDYIPNVIIGDPNSFLIQKVIAGDDNHREWMGSDENCQKLIKWIVEDSLNFNRPIVHLAGPMDVSSSDFHAKNIYEKGWSMESCKLCHGTDYSGGHSQKSCNKCHYPNPEDCNTCHGGMDNKTGAPPPDLNGNKQISFRGVGGHTIHLQGVNISNGVKCESCHLVPQNVHDSQHIYSEEPAEVVFGDIAVALGAQAIWDAESMTCKNVYCHGYFSAGDSSVSVSWTDFILNDKCAPTCHLIPPAGKTRSGLVHHPGYIECWLCHPVVVDKNNNFINKSLHINGVPDR